MASIAVPLFGFALAAAYVPGIVGAASSPRWAVLAAAGAIAVVLLKPTQNIQILCTCTGLAFACWALLTALWSPAPEAFDQAWKLCLLALLFVLGSKLDLRALLIGAAAGVGISSALVILDRLGLVAYAQAFPPSGLFGNGLYLAEFAAMVVAGLLAYRLWWWAALCAPSLLLVHLPRGPLVALACAGILWLWSIRRQWGEGWAGAAVVVLAIAAVPLVAYRPESVLHRIDMWSGIIPALTPFGHGLGAYFGAAPLLDVAADTAAGRPLHANNVLLELAYDTGLVGAALACTFIAVLLRRADLGAPATLVVAVFLVEGLVGFPLYLPATAGLFALAAGSMART